MADLSDPEPDIDLSDDAERVLVWVHQQPGGEVLGDMPVIIGDALGMSHDRAGRALDELYRHKFVSPVEATVH